MAGPLLCFFTVGDASFSGLAGGLVLAASSKRCIESCRQGTEPWNSQILLRATLSLIGYFGRTAPASPTPEASVNFMPEMWARIEARQVSTDWFGLMAKILVTAALAASAILGLLISPRSQPSAFFDGTFVEAMRVDQAATLEPLHLDRIYQLQVQ